jgi:transposase
MNKFTIQEFRAAYPNDDACLDKIFQLRYNNLICPKCENDKPFVKVKKRRSYQCPSCSHQIYPTKDTIFEKTTTPLTYWFYAIYLQTTTRNGVSAKELERSLNLCYKTALRMAHQIKKLMADNHTDKFFGECEVDETYLGSKLGNLKNKKKAEVDKIPFRNPMYGKTTIFGIIDRDGRVFTKVVTAPTKENIIPLIREKVDSNCHISSDSSTVYKQLQYEYIHDSVNHQMREWVAGNFHTNNIESFWNQVKRTIKGTHISVSPKHIQKYLDEVAFRWEHKKMQGEMFDIILSRVV